MGKKPKRKKRSPEAGANVANRKRSDQLRQRLNREYRERRFIAPFVAHLEDPVTRKGFQAFIRAPFFVGHPGLSKQQYGPVVDFIQDRKFEDQEYIIVDGCRVDRGPAQPAFRMKRQSVVALLRDVEGRSHLISNNIKQAML